MKKLVLALLMFCMLVASPVIAQEAEEAPKETPKLVELAPALSYDWIINPWDGGFDVKHGVSLKFLDFYDGVANLKVAWIPTAMEENATKFVGFGIGVDALKVIGKVVEKTSVDITVPDFVKQLNPTAGLVWMSNMSGGFELPKWTEPWIVANVINMNFKDLPFIE